MASCIEQSRMVVGYGSGDEVAQWVLLDRLFGSCGRVVGSFRDFINMNVTCCAEISLELG